MLCALVLDSVLLCHFALYLVPCDIDVEVSACHWILCKEGGILQKVSNKFSPVKRSATLNNQNFCFGLAYFFVEMGDDDTGV